MGDPDSASLEANMEDHITASLGPIVRLLRRLHSFEASQQSLPEGLSTHKIKLLEEGLEVLYTYLKDAPEAEDPSCTPKWWIKEVRELSYDTEDYVDEVMDSGAGVRRSARLSTIFRIISKRKRRPQTAKDFSQLMSRVDDARERRKSFKLAPETIRPDSGQAGVSCLTPKLSLELPVSAASISVHVDTDGGRSIVGVEEPMNKLVNLLAFDDTDQKQLKVIPIFGSACVGKTTLARTLYHKFGGKFQRRAFLRVSRNPDMRRLLTSMLSQIKAPPRAHVPSDAQDLIDSIIKHLGGKRYFIIIDDLWTASAWNIISRALPDGNCCSRIITTTQIEDVALACCGYQSEYIIKMGPLNDGESRKLFFSSVFGSEGQGGCPKDFETVAGRIIRKCGGLPLSIVNIASLLPSKPKLVMEQWENVQRSVPSTLGTNPTSEGMKDVLILIYNNLPPHLKTCLLYLSMYPEGYTIRKDDLVKQWVAEGFVGDTEHVARGYFDELVRRGMIQPVDTNYNGEVLSCTVNQTVLDLIRYKSMEDNFIIAVDYFESTPGLPDKVRRLSVQFGGAKSAKIPESIVISQVRSLLFRGFFKCVPPIVDYRLLQVLILDIWADQDDASFDLTRICELFRLRYLKIECNVNINLPAKIRSLQYLETLEVDAGLSVVPSDIVHSQSLLHLCLPSQANLPAGIDHMTSLRSLGYFNLGNNSRDNVLGLGKLINLWDLRLTCSTVPSDRLIRNMEHLGSILGELSKLKSLIMDAGASSLSISCDDLNSVSPAPALLETLQLPRICIFPSIPKWFRDLSKLCILKIAVRELSRENIDILKGLRALTSVSLYVWITPTGGIVFGKEGFRALRYFKFTCTAPCLTFEKDAMRNVQRLKLRFDANGLEQYDPAHAGFEHLLGLEEISVKIGSVDVDEYDSKAVLWMNVFSKLPSSPIFNMQLGDRIFNGDRENSSARNEKKHQTTETVQDVGVEVRSNEQYVIQAFAGEGTSKQAEADSRTSVASGSSLQTQILGEDESKATDTGSALEGPSSKHPNTPDNVNREFAESIIHDDKETSSTRKEEKHFTPEIKGVTSLRTGATSEISSPQPEAPLQTGATSEITSPQPEAPLQTGATSEISSHQPEAPLQTSEECSDEQRGIEEKGPREDSRTSMPSGYTAHLQDSDCTLRYFDLGSNSEDNVMDLGKLTNLQDLHLTCPTVQPADNLEHNMKCLGSILGKLSSLKCLALVPAEDSSHVNTLQDDAGASSMSISCDVLSSVSPAPALLERLELLPRICIFPSIPKWFGELSRLCTLKIAVRELSREDIHILKGLPVLTALSLYVWTAPTGWIIFDEGFGLLEYFKFMCTAPYMSFVEGAMPNVRKIKLGFNANRMKRHRPVTFGFRHLKGLRDISIKFGGAGADESKKMAVYLSELEAIVKHPINVKFVDQTFFGEQDKSSVTKGQEVQQRCDEDVNKEIDSRISIKSESSSHMENPEHKTVTVVTGDGTVSASTGAMYSVLRKLAVLMGDEYPKLRGNKEVMSLKEELGAMNALLEQLVDVPELNMEMKGLRNQMREMTYAVEDCMDELQFHEGIHEATWFPEKWDMLQQLIHQIRDLRGRVGKADLPSMAHTTEIQTLPSSYKATESGLHTHYNKAIGLVGIDGPRDEIVRRMNGAKRLQVACILGSGGLGKTTLATEVYHHIEGPFDHRVFIEVPQKIDIARLHKIIIRQLSPRDEPDRDMNVTGYDIDVVRKYLRDKRYLIVIDGVWSAQTWEVVKSALPNNNRGSRILMTTDVRDIAESCNNHSSGFIYFMQPLTAQDSLSLLRSILFGSERSCPVELEKVAERILVVYGGIPMAIIIMAGILASIPAEVAEGVMVAKRMEPAGDGDPSKEMIRKMFDISYSSLPRDLKSCLLYLSVFRENYFGPIRNAEISYGFYRNFTGTNSIPSRFRKEFRFPNGAFVRKDRLIWRWIAEGFLPKKSEESLWETGERYFLELIARNLIEPVYEEDDNEVPVGCKVHGLILEFIASLSNEENFVTTSAEATHMQHDVTRRLIVSNQEEDPLWRLINRWRWSKDSQLRSITILEDDQGENALILAPLLFCARFLRVLDLEDFKSLREYYLMGIEELVLLSYLGLGGTGIRRLPEEIGELEQLETLDLRRTILWTLPASIMKLQKLVRLLVEPHVELPREIREMQDLEEISTVDAHSSSSLKSVAQLLFKSKPLRMLDVIFGRSYGRDGDTTETDRRDVMSFLREVGNSNLQSLSLCFDSDGDVDLLRILLDSWEVRPHHLRRFKLELHLQGAIPPQMASLVNITHLDIKIPEVQAEGVRILGDLPNLVVLTLIAGISRRCVIGGEGFQCLKVFTLSCSFEEGLEFTPGAMPQLRRLRLYFTPRESSYGDYDFGIQHLSCLTRVHATIDCDGATISEVEALEAAIRRQVSEFPIKPTVEFIGRLKKKEKGTINTFLKKKVNMEFLQKRQAGRRWW